MTTIPDHSAGSFGAAEQRVQQVARTGAGLDRAEAQLALDALDLLADVEDAAAEVDVLPAQTEMSVSRTARDRAAKVCTIGTDRTHPCTRSLWRPSGPDGKGQARGQARDARGAPLRLAPGQDEGRIKVCPSTCMRKVCHQGLTAISVDRLGDPVQARQCP